jgi:hypothetical protein
VGANDKDNPALVSVRQNEVVKRRSKRFCQSGSLTQRGADRLDW